MKRTKLQATAAALSVAATLGVPAALGQSPSPAPSGQQPMMQHRSMPHGSMQNGSMQNGSMQHGAMMQHRSMQHGTGIPQGSTGGYPWMSEGATHPDEAYTPPATAAFTGDDYDDGIYRRDVPVADFEGTYAYDPDTFAEDSAYVGGLTRGEAVTGTAEANRDLVFGTIAADVFDAERSYGYPDYYYEVWDRYTFPQPSSDFDNFLSAVYDFGHNQETFGQMTGLTTDRVRFVDVGTLAAADNARDLSRALVDTRFNHDTLKDLIDESSVLEEAIDDADVDDDRILALDVADDGAVTLYYYGDEGIALDTEADAPTDTSTDDANLTSNTDFDTAR